MTYGEVNRDVRAAVVDLLGYRRVTYYLGASRNGKNAAWASPEHARAVTDLVQRYRALVWRYAHQVVQAANPPAPGGRAPVWDLLTRLEKRIAERSPDAGRLPGGRVADLEELATPHDVPLVEAWRRAAAAAVAGLDRELGSVAEQIEPGQRLVLAKDAAEVTLGLLRLDDRYRWTPGWQLLGGGRDKSRPRRSVQNHHATGIVSIALATVEWADQHIKAADYAVDGLGWKPRPQLIDTPSDEPIERALAALHNTAVHLRREFPRALALRGLARAHRETSLHAARLAESAGLGVVQAEWERRAQTYAALSSIMRTSVGGNLGRGDHSLGAATVALNYLSNARVSSREQIERLSDVLAEIDQGIGTRLLQGIDDRRYFVKDGRHLAARPEGGVYRSVDRYVAIADARRQELRDLADTLCGKPATPAVDTGVASSRVSLMNLLFPDGTWSARAKDDSGATRTTALLTSSVPSERAAGPEPAIAL